MKPGLLGRILVVTLLFFLPMRAVGHDGWIGVEPIVEPGQPVTIALMLGNHSNEHGSFRLAGKWDRQYTQLLILDPAGKTVDVTDSIIDLGEDPERTGPKGPKGFHLARFIPEKPGVYIVLARQDRTIRQDNGASLRTSRNARASFIALDNPRVAAAAKANGFDRRYGLDTVLEIIPLSSPFATFAKGSLMFELLHLGRPAPNRVVTVIGQFGGTASAQDLKTDERGRLTVTVPAADTYLARAKFDEDRRSAQSAVEKNSYEATYVFRAFKRF